MRKCTLTHCIHPRQVVDYSSGANCFIAIDGIDRQSGQRGNTNSGPAPTKHRFLEGGVDEVSFLGPELGPLRALLVGPEAGRWYCDEVDVYSSRTGHTDRCARLQGASEHASVLVFSCGNLKSGTGWGCATR